ncbi:transposase [Micromonospora sp. NPDC023814]|uniref:transposase n=1 Tax=Micromonospora sp. NPDC023814 TaxID=3154596 RepID=UPI0033D2A5F5
MVRGDGDGRPSRLRLHDLAGANSGNWRNGRRAKTLLTEVGTVNISVPRDHDGTFTPVIVPKRSRRPGGVEDLAVSLSAKGLTHGEICARTWPKCTGRRCPGTGTAITDRGAGRHDGVGRTGPLTRSTGRSSSTASTSSSGDGQVANRARPHRPDGHCQRWSGHPRAVGR